MTVDKKILDSFLVLSAYNSFAKRYLDSKYVITDTNTIPDTDLYLCEGSVNDDCTASMYLNIPKSSLLVYRNSDLVLNRKMNADILIQFLMDNDCQRVLEELYKSYSFAEWKSIRSLYLGAERPRKESRDAGLDMGFCGSAF